MSFPFARTLSDLRTNRPLSAGTPVFDLHAASGARSRPDPEPEDDKPRKSARRNDNSNVTSTVPSTGFGWTPPDVSTHTGTRSGPGAGTGSHPGGTTGPGVGIGLGTGTSTGFSPGIDVSAGATHHDSTSMVDGASMADNIGVTHRDGMSTVNNMGATHHDGTAMVDGTGVIHHDDASAVNNTGSTHHDGTSMVDNSAQQNPSARHLSAGDSEATSATGTGGSIPPGRMDVVSRPTDVGLPSGLSSGGNDSSSGMADASSSSSSSRRVYHDSPTKLHMMQGVHGDALLLEYAEGRTESGTRKFWLIDGGPGNSLRTNVYATAAHALFATMNADLSIDPDKKRKVDKLERLIVTHNDDDHTTGAMYLLASLMHGNPANAGGKLKPKKDAPVTTSETKPKTKRMSKKSEELVVAVEIARDVAISNEHLSWIIGHKSFSGGSSDSVKQFPIEKIWFNDRANVMDYAYPSYAESSKTWGWMTKVLDILKEQATGLTIPILNDEFVRTHPERKDRMIRVVSKELGFFAEPEEESEPNATSSSSSSSSKPTKATQSSSLSKPSQPMIGEAKNLSPTFDHVRVLGPRPQDLGAKGLGRIAARKASDWELVLWNGAAPVAFHKPVKTVTSKWRKIDHVKTSQEKTETNLSSIVIEFTNAQGDRGTGTNDTTGSDMADTGTVADHSSTSTSDNIHGSTSNASTASIVGVLGHSSSTALPNSNMRLSSKDELPSTASSTLPTGNHSVPSTAPSILRTGNDSVPSSAPSTLRTGNDSVLTNVSGALPGNGRDKDTILFTGDSTGAILDINYRDGDVPYWDIMKIMHHGSSRNNNIVPSTEKGAKVNVRQAVVRFFRKYVAMKYCISGDILGGRPNPDILTLLGLVRARQYVRTNEAFYIYITNGLTVKQYFQITRMTNMKMHPRIFVLKNGYVNYGTVNTSAVSDPERDAEPAGLDGEECNWMEIANDQQHFEYIKKALQHYKTALDKVASNDGDLIKFLGAVQPRVSKAKKKAKDKTSVELPTDPPADDDQVDEDDVDDEDEDEDADPDEVEDENNLSEENDVNGVSDRIDLRDDRIAKGLSTGTSSSSSSSATRFYDSHIAVPTDQDWDLKYKTENDTSPSAMQYTEDEPFRIPVNLRAGRSAPEEKVREEDQLPTSTPTSSSSSVPLPKNRKVGKGLMPMVHAARSSGTTPDAPARIRQSEREEIAETDSAEYIPTGDGVATIDDAGQILPQGMMVKNLTPPRIAVPSVVTTSTLATPCVGQGASQIAFPSLSKPNQPTSWHQLMLSGLVSSDLDSIEDLTDSPVPNSEVTPKQGKKVWVDLATFMSILIAENMKPNNGAGPRALPPEMVAKLKIWFCSPKTSDSKGNVPVLASMLLPLFLGMQGTERFLDALPLNINGYNSDLHSVSNLHSWAPMMQLSVENFRARIHNPLPSEQFECYAMYFELNAPHPDLSSISPGEVLTWHVPFQNALWQHGQISFAHSGPLRVKIINPLAINRVIFCHFDSIISIVRNFGVMSGACHGTMVSSPGEPAVYDIQLTPDVDGDFDVAWLCKVFAPQGLSKSSMFDGLITQICAPFESALEPLANKLVSEELGLRDVGVILKQSREGLKAVYIEDVYGTISLAQLLKIDALLQVVGVPPQVAEKIAAETPDLTVTLGEIAFAAGHSISFALSKQIDGFGVIALQCGQMANCETRFDLWIVCEPGLALGDDGIKQGLLSKLGFSKLMNDFEAARVFSSALSHLSVPFLRLSYTKADINDPSSNYHLDELSVVVEVLEVNIPSKANPIISLSCLRLAIEHHGPTAESRSDITVNGSAVMSIDGCDVIAQFTISHAAEDIADFLADVDTSDVEADSNKATNGDESARTAQKAAPTNMSEAEKPEGDEAGADESNAATLSASSHKTKDFPDASHDTGGFVGDIEIQLTFPGRTPTIGAMISHIVGDVLSSLGLEDIKKNIPSSLLSIFGCTSFRNVYFTVSKPSKGESFTISKFSACFDLEALAGDLNIFGSTVIFEMPILNVVILDPTLPTRSYQISVEGVMIVSSCVCNIFATFTDPPSGGGDASSINVRVDGSQGDHGGIPIGEVATFFAKKTAEFFGFDNMIPAVLKDAASDVGNVIDAFYVNDIMVTFKDTSSIAGKSDWKLVWVEGIAQLDKNWTLFPGFEIGEIMFHMSHNTGAGTAKPDANASTMIVFNSTLTLKKNRYLVQVTHDSQQQSTCVEINADGTSLNIVSLMEQCIDDVNLDFIIPSAVERDIKKMLDIKIDTFYLTYLAAVEATGTLKARGETINLSISGEIDILGICMSSITISCQKQKDGSWGYTLSVALQSPCSPLANFIPMPGMDGIVVKDGQFSYFNKSLSTLVNNGEAPPDCTGGTLLFSGRLILEGNSFMKLISSIVKISEIDIAITQKEFSVQIPPCAGGTSIFNTFYVLSFTLEIKNEAFGLGAEVEFRADWLCKEKAITMQFDLVVSPEGSVGADFFLVHTITNPFGIPGIAITDASFSLLWLLEAEEPRSLSGKFGLEFTGGSSKGKVPKVSNSFEFMMDEEMPTNNYFKMDIEGLTLGNIMAVLVGEDLPKVASVLNGDFFGFKSLIIDFEPFGDNAHFFVKADFFFFGLEGKVDAHIYLNKGLTLAANLSVVDILGIIKIHAYPNPNDVSGPINGPFIYLNTQATDLLSGSSKPPDWMHVTSNDPKLLGNNIFALTGEISFLGLKAGIYGVLNTSDGLMFIMREGEKLDTGVASLSFDETLSISMNGSRLSASTTYELSFGLNLPDIEIFGFRIGSYSGTAISLKDKMSVVVSYGAGDWKSDGLEYKVEVNVDILGLNLSATLDLDLSITNIEQLPSKIESFIEDKVVTFLEDKIASPFIEGYKAVAHLANEAAAALSAGFNAAADDIMHGMSEAGHALGAIADALKDTLNLGIDEVASTFINFGHDISDVADAIGNTFAASANEVASALSSAGVTVEHALEAAWGDGAAELTKDFTMLGNSIAAFGADAEHAIVDVIDDIGDLAKDAVNDIGSIVEAPVKALENIVRDVCVIS